MSESAILDRIDALLADERMLLEAGRASPASLAEIRDRRAQLWDLIRRRRARAAAGGDPDEIGIRPAGVVVSYGRAAPARGRCGAAVVQTTRRVRR